MDENDVKAPAFCPTCGARVRRSLAERIGVEQDTFSLLIAIVIVGAILVTITGTIVYGVVVSGQDSRRHEDEMAEKGFVQTTRTIDPSTAFRAGKYVTEWAKEEKK